MMFKLFKRALALVAFAGGAILVTFAPAQANANTSVICSWQKELKLPNGGAKRVAIFFRNDLTASSPHSFMSDDQWQRAQCDGYYNELGKHVEGAIDQIADKIVSLYGSLDGWQRQRFETTWADRCTNSDPVANFFGNVWQRTGCVNYVPGQVNYAQPGQATPHDLLSCMYNGRPYSIAYDWNQVTFQDVDNGKVLSIKDNQLNCVGSPIYNTPPPQ